ncbi:MAG TPA: hypothetical protein VMS71_01040 [Candidatus Acidoferrum sp.]|nr:hypothetical protein [Candidatus Acidoferrum sp.]
MFRRFLILVCFLPMAHSVYAFEFMTGHGNGLGQSLLLSHSTPSMLLSAPTGGLDNGEWRIESGISRLYDLSDLDQAFLASAFRWRGLIAAAGVSQFGNRDLYAERIAKLALSYRYRHFVLGGSGSIMSTSFGGGYAPLNTTTFGLGAAASFKRVYASFSADNLNSPRLDPSSPVIRPIYSLYGEFWSTKSLSTLIRSTFEKTEKPQFAVGQRIGVSELSSLLWGLQTAPIQFGGGVELGIKSSRISYCVSYHPVLGMSHTIAVSYGSKTATTGATDAFK